MAAAPPASRSSRAGPLLLLGVWLGAMLFFAAVMAPAAFAVLDEPAQAGRLVSRTLTTLDLAGVAFGLVLAFWARRLGAAPWLQGLPLLLAMLCIASHFGVSATLAEIRATPGWADEPDLRRRFGQLHGVSVGLLGATFLGALALAVGHARGARAIR